MEMKYYVVDAFTENTFEGNPASVCLDNTRISDIKRQRIAAEFNLSETVFVNTLGRKRRKFKVKYFTPTVPIPFCGHATFAAAKVIHRLYRFKSFVIQTAHGLELFVEINGDEIGIIFPLFKAKKTKIHNSVLKALGLKKYEEVRWIEAIESYLIILKNEKQLLKLKPDFQGLLKSKGNQKGLVISAAAKADKFDFCSRCFFPWSGINEDPVTGSAHSALGKYWSKRLDKSVLNAHQASQRGGVMQLEILSKTGMEVRAKAVTFALGNIIF